MAIPPRAAMIGLSTSSGQIQPVWVHAGMDSGDFSSSEMLEERYTSMLR
jgi:hypothetical protein